jgi:hypothetical protein
VGRTRDERNADAAHHRLLASGSKLAGAVGGAGTGLAVGGPAGAIAGAAAGAIVEVAAELVGRQLGRRGHARVGAVFYIAEEAIGARLLAGDEPRDDDFFNRSATTAGTSPAAELLEGVALAARDAYEERKLRYLGLLYATFVFDATISHARAHQLLTVAERLTYRQLVLLSVLVAPADELAQLDAPRSAQTPEQASLASEIGGLSSLGLVTTPLTTGRISGAVSPAYAEPTHVASALFAAMRLDLIPEEDRRQLVVDVYGRHPS